MSFVLAKIGDRAFHTCFVFGERCNADVAHIAKQAPNLSGVVVVINVEVLQENMVVARVR